MKAVKQYVEDFFLKYLEEDEEHLGFIEQAQKAVQYRLELADYGEEVREWLVGIYLTYGRCVDRLVEHLLSQCELFLLKIGRASCRERVWVAAVDGEWNR